MRTFLIVWTGQIVSLVGIGLTQFGLGAWVFQTTGSATQFAMIGAVRPNHRFKGFGRQLMENLEERLKEMGCPKIDLMAREGNKKVLAPMRPRSRTSTPSSFWAST